MRTESRQEGGQERRGPPNSVHGAGEWTPPQYRGVVRASLIWDRMCARNLEEKERHLQVQAILMACCACCCSYGSKTTYALRPCAQCEGPLTRRRAIPDQGKTAAQTSTLGPLPSEGGAVV
eukprot:1139402-Pelagomonas_calceolata.AAC.8